MVLANKMKGPHMSLKDEATRAYIYRVLTAAVPLVTAYGIIDQRTAALWLGVIGALLGIGLASMNTSTKGPDL
jgi:hypothetical protein